MIDPHITKLRRLLMLSLAVLAIALAFLWSLNAQLSEARMEVANVRDANALIIGAFEPKKDLNEVCPAWLFQTNIAQARERICKGHK